METAIASVEPVLPAKWVPKAWAELARGEGVWVDDIDDDGYFALPLASRSRLEVLREDVPTYYARFEAPEAERLPDDDTKALRVGRYTHCAILQPGRWENDFAREPDFATDGRTKEGKAERAEWRQSSAGRTIAKSQEYDLAVSMLRALARDQSPTGVLGRQMLLGADATERVMVWRDRVTGLLCRARLDAIHYDSLIADLKTADDESPEAFGIAAARRGYARQAAMYIDGVEAVTGKVLRFADVVIRSSRPHAIAVYELDAFAIAAGRKQYRSSLLELERRMAAGDWLANHQKQPITLALPGWALGDS